MVLIFAVDENWNIGYKGKMLTEIRADLRRFREITEGNIVVMGRKTFDAIPGNEPLPNRINIIMTRNKDFEDRGFVVVDSVWDLLETLNEINQNGEKEVFITGGQNVVEQLMHHCHSAYITKILKTFDKADTAMVNLDEREDWKIVDESEIYEENGTKFQYVEYKRI